jgi:hypothetical protein
VTGEFENPIAVAVVFASMVKKMMFKGNERLSALPFFEAYNKAIIPYKQSERFTPLFHDDFLKVLSGDPANDTGWVYDGGKTKPKQKIIALGKDKVIKLLMDKFKEGNNFVTPAGMMSVSKINTYQDVPEEGGLFRFADIVFELNGKFAGRFVFRASSNDPAFVGSFETPANYGTKDEIAARFVSVGGLVLDWLEQNNLARVSGEGFKYDNKDSTEPVLKEYRQAQSQAEPEQATAYLSKA